MSKQIKSNIEEIEKFSNIILEIVKKDHISYIEAITEYCETVGLEIDVAVKFLTPFITSKITEEAIKNNLIEKTSTLRM